MSQGTAENRSTSSPPSTMAASPNSLKRKEAPEHTDHPDVPTNDAPQQGEYETGRVICEVCGNGVSFRDEETGGFTLKHWEAHRTSCVAPSSTAGEPVIYTPESTAEALAQPPTKRRRAKRTEEERIEYLRADPYVAKFEAYRVLCASCDKWIRLRPNSTYCSIPWDAHRKSCLSKKISSKNVYALEERNSLFAKDPDVRKFDAERVLCNICDRWIAINPEDHLQAVQKWLQHRSSCHKATSGVHMSQESSNAAQPPPEQRVVAARLPSHYHATPVPTSSSRPSPKLSTIPSSPSLYSHSHSSHSHPCPQPQSIHPPSKQDSPNPESSSSFHDLGASSFVPSHESRRRNAEQRAATLKADRLIGQVEANRVFCSLCQKWVQLRQDSSYCAYPWLQHRGKCLARHQRRAQKAAEMADMKFKRQQTLQEEDELMSDADDNHDEEDPESEEGVDVYTNSEKEKLREALKTEHKKMFSQPRSGHGSLILHHPSQALHPTGKSYTSSASYELDADGELDIDADGELYDEPRSRPPVRRPYPVGMADLDSLSGRRNFVFVSIDYLFTTTYESTDDMTISALLTYLNAAMPPDKHEDFDTSEVIKAVAALQEKGRIIFEGDTLRLAD